MESKSNKWSIWLAERSTVVRVKQHLVEYGKPFSHPFLALTNPENQVLGELHGTLAKKIKYGTSYLFDHFTGAVRDEKLNAVLAQVVKPFYPKTILIGVKGERQFGRAVEKQEVLSGSKEEVMDAWEKVQAVFPEINACRLPFYRYATQGSGFANCQVVLRGALDQSGVLTNIPDLKLGQTGWTEKPKAAITLSL